VTKRVMNIPLVFGVKNGVEPKYAPSGVMAVAKNLRVQKDGRLVSRTGYVLQSMVTTSGQLNASDLHEYQGRLCALGTDLVDGFPSDIFELTNGSAAEVWRGSDVGKNVPRHCGRCMWRWIRRNVVAPECNH